MAGTVVMQVLVRILAARGGHHAGTADVAVHQEGELVGIRAEHFQREVGARAHLVVVVGGDVQENSLASPVSSWARFMASYTSGRVFLIGANTWLPCGSSFLMKSPPSQNS